MSWVRALTAQMSALSQLQNYQTRVYNGFDQMNALISGMPTFGMNAMGTPQYDTFMRQARQAEIGWVHSQIMEKFSSAMYDAMAKRAEKAMEADKQQRLNRMA